MIWPRGHGPRGLNIPAFRPAPLRFPLHPVTPKGGRRVSIQGPGRVDCERKLHALLTGRDYQHKNIETLRYAEPKGDQDPTAKVRESYNTMYLAKIFL